MHSGMTAFVIEETIKSMTNQVDNVTETVTNELSEQEAYDAEWGEDDDSDQDINSNLSSDSESSDDSNEDGDHGKAEDTTTHGETVANDDQGNTNESANGSAESAADDDIWATATDAQKLAFKKAQNDLNRETGRARSQQQRNADLEKEVQAANAKYAEETRTKGEYETEHPELFNEVMDRIEARNGTHTQAAAAVDNGDELPDDIKLVFKIHPDANDLMQTSEWETFASNFTAEQTAQFEGDDPYAFVDLLAEYKTQRRIATHTSSSSDDLSDTLTQSTGSASATSKTNGRRLTAAESYDAEWDLD